MKEPPIFAESDIRAIYLAFPRRVKPKTAYVAIRRALAEISCRDGSDPVKWLLGRVTAYAKSQVGREKCYIPYPASFMNAGSYDEDDREWSAWRKNGTVAPERDVFISRAVQAEIASIKETMASGAWKRMDPRWQESYENRLKELGG